MQLEITNLRTVKDDDPDVRSMEFHHAPVTVGSHSANLVHLADVEIAPYHAIFLPVGEDQWVYQPTVQDGQTTINEQPVLEKTELEDGDVIIITHFEIRFTLDLEPELVLPEPGNVQELARIRDFPLPPRSEVHRVEDDVTLDTGRQRALAAFALKLRSCTDIPRLLECTVGMLLEELGARTAWMGVRRKTIGRLEFVHGRHARGEESGEPNRLETFEYRCLTRHQFIRIPKTGDKETQSVLAVPLLGASGALGLLFADTRRRTRVFDDADLDFLTVVASLIVPQLEAIIHELLDHRAKLAADELTLLHQIQAQLDLRSVPQWPELQIAAYAKPGLKEAGDVYDIMRLPNGLAAVMIGRIHASTARAALAMAEVRSAFRIAGLHADPPHIQLKALNWLLYDEKEPCVLDVAILVTNPKTGAAEFCTGGAIGAVVIDPRGNSRSLVDAERPAVGTTKGYEYASSSERLRVGETLALFSPGCCTTENIEGEPIGAERFQDALCDGFGQSASVALDDLVSDQAAFLKNGRPPADITILLVRRVSA